MSWSATWEKESDSRRQRVENKRHPHPPSPPPPKKKPKCHSNCSHINRCGVKLDSSILTSKNGFLLCTHYNKYEHKEGENVPIEMA